MRPGGRGPRRGTPADWLVVGLGNPGARYAGTRHNAGFEVVDLLARRHGDGVLRGEKGLMATVAQVLVPAEGAGTARVVLAEPTTYMNDSGQAVAPLCRRFGIDEPGRLVVVHDELDLALGRLKVKEGGGLAGHNGLRSITAHLHTQDYVRVRVGVGKPPSREQGAGHVLSKVARAEREVLDVVVEHAADAVDQIVAEGATAAMDRYNGLALDDR